MKATAFSIIFILLTSFLLGQNVVIQGQIKSLASNFEVQSNTAVFYKYLDPERKEMIAAVPVNQYGIFQQYLPVETQVHFYIYYNRFVPIDTLIYTGSNEIMQLKFNIRAKSTHFTKETAREDIANGKIRIVFHDLEMYRLFRKSKFREHYGFHFEYLHRPDSWQELRDIAEYNAVMEQHLDEQNSNGWRKLLYAEMDSLIIVRESYAGLEAVPRPENTEVTEVQIVEVLPEAVLQKEPAMALQAKSISLESSSDIEITDKRVPNVEQPVFSALRSKPIPPKAAVMSLSLDQESDLTEPLLPHVAEPPISSLPTLELYLPSSKPALKEMPAVVEPDPDNAGSIIHHLEEAQQKVLEKAILACESLFGREELQRIPSSWQYPQQEAASPEMAKLIEENRNIYQHFYQGRTDWNTGAPVAFMLQRIDQDPDYQTLKVIQYWAAWHYQALIPELIFRLTVDTEVGLTNAREIIIWDRVQEGDLELDGPGAEVADDLYTVAGRANYLLKNLTGEDFGKISMKTSPQERVHMRDQWVNWLLNLRLGKISSAQG